MEVKAQAPIGNVKGCPSKNIGMFEIRDQFILRLWCYWCYETHDGSGSSWHYECDQQEPIQWQVGRCLSCIKIEPYDGPLGNPSRPRVKVTFEPTGTVWIVYNDTSITGTENDYTFWEFELVGP